MVSVNPVTTRASVRVAFISICLVFIAAALVLSSSTSGARLRNSQNPSSLKRRRAAFVPGQILVRYRSESSASKSTRAHTLFTTEGMPLQIAVERFGGSNLVPGLRLARVTPGETLQSVEALMRQPDVLYAEPDYILRADAIPNDSFYAANQPNLPRIGAPTAWDITKGSNTVVVGVIDQGIDINHLDLAANIWTNPSPGSVPGITGDLHGYNFVNNNGTIFSGDDNETHASHVAGIIGAVGNNNKGVAGVNWSVSLMSLKFLDQFGGGSTSDAIRACDYANQMRLKGINIRVLNASFGGAGFSQAFIDSLAQLDTNGILFVAAAGNIDDGTREPNNDRVPHYPSNFNVPNIIAVASTDQADNFSSSFSHFGPTSVDLGAPGEHILSTTPHCSDPGPDPKPCNPAFTDANGDTYSFFSGTSMATPHVAGAAALLWAQNPNLTVQQVKNLLLLNGDVRPSLIDKTLTGRRLNVGNSFQSLLEGDTTAPGAASNFRINSQNGRALNLGWNTSGDDGATGQASLYQVNFVDGGTGQTIPLKGVVPGPSGAAQLADIKIPFRHTSGTIQLREFDNAGNQGTPVSLPVGVPLSAADPYTIIEGTAAPLSNGGAPVPGLNEGSKGDDNYADFSLPGGFSFPFFGSQFTSVTVSTNGALYMPFTAPPRRGNGDADDVPSSPGTLGGYKMIAGLWDDLDLRVSSRADAGVFFSQPAPNRVIFRWQGVPCNFDGDVCTGGDPVNFEIELNSNGTIKTRYGTGNTDLFPTVGIGGGEQDGYAVQSHTSEEIKKSLTNASEVTFTPRAQTVSTVQFAQANTSVSEGATSLTVTVTRTGDTVSVATLNYATTDTDTFTVPCSTTQGAAFGRCDYATSVDTLTFAAGETSKTFTVPIIDDAVVEGNETFGLSLTNAVGATLGTPSTATVTIMDNDSGTPPNPIFDTSFFVRQQYLDFLSREPDTPGFNAWTGVLNNCSDVNNNPNCDRITVSASFFQSQEFQLKGYFIYRFYKLAFNRLPSYVEIVNDMRAVTGSTPEEVYQKKASFTNGFVDRPEFVTAYGSLSNLQFVTNLMARYTLTQITTPDPVLPDGATKVSLTTSDLVTQLTNQSLTRAQVLRAIADSDQVFSLEFNSAFVAMQYFGYLRRTPDSNGFNAWLTYLNAHPTDSRTMVNGFLNSDEYRLRFGP